MRWPWVRRFDTLWLAGRVLEAGVDPPAWEVLGLFRGESAARARCTKPEDFVAPIPLDQPYPDDGPDATFRDLEWPARVTR